MRIDATMFLVSMAISSPVWAQGGEWTARTDINVDGAPRAMMYHSTVALDGAVYVIGGRFMQGGPWDYSHGVLRYDPVTDSWALRTGITGGTSWCGSAACVFDGDIYQFGGGALILSQIAECWRYSVASDSWTRLADLPAPRQFGAAVTVADRIWFLGGWQTSGTTYAKTDVFIFDPAGGGSWSPGPSLPAQDAAGHGIRSLGCGLIGSRLIVAGGYAVSSTMSDRCYVYDFAEPGWVRKSGLPGTFAAGASAVANERLYLMGGLADRQAVFEYAPTADEWASREDIPDERFHDSAAAVSDRIYLPGGASESTMLELTPPDFPRVTDLRQGRGLPEGAWTGANVELRATTIAPNGGVLALEVQVALDGHAFNAGLQFSGELAPPGEVTITAGPMSDGSWRWRCRAVDPMGMAGAWVEFETSAVDFQADGTPPATPTPLAPGGRVVINNRRGGTVEFTWTEVADGVTYEAQFGIQAPHVYYEDPVITTTGRVAMHLRANTEGMNYVWRVRAIDALGNPGEWCEPKPFQVHFEDGINHSEDDAAKVCGGAVPAGESSIPGVALILATMLLGRRIRF